MTSEISEYERLRKKNIEENNRKLRELGLPAMATSTFKRPEDPGRKVPPEEPSPLPESGAGWGVTTRAKGKKQVAETETDDDEDEQEEEATSEEERAKVKRREAKRGNASEPKLWPLQSNRKKSRAGDEEDLLLSPGLQHTLDECELDADDSFVHNSQEEVAGGPNKRLLMELELRQLDILKQMAEEGSNPIGLRDQVRRLGLTAQVEGGNGGGLQRQSKLKNLRRSVKKGDDEYVGAGGHRSWVEVNELGFPTGQRRPDWLTRLRGYSRDLDWSIDDFKQHPRPLLMAIKDKMAAHYEYRGGLGDVPEPVFFQILRQQMRTRRSNMKKLIESGGPLPTYVKRAHVENFKRLIQRTDKIAEASRMKAARQTVQTVSYSGRSEGEVRSRLAADLERPPTQEEVEAELATPGKSGRVRSSSSRGPGTNGREGDKALAKVQNEMLTFRGELDIMKSMMAQLLQNSQKQKTGDVEPPASSDVGTDVIQMISEKVAPALSQEQHAIGKSAESGHTGSTATLEPLQDTNPDSASLPETGKERPVAKKRKGEAEKLLADNAARPTRRALNRQKEVLSSGASQDRPLELEDDVDHVEPAQKRAGKRQQKTASPQRKKKKVAPAAKPPPVAAKVPPVRVSDSGRRKIVVLNVVGLLCDLRPLHDRRDWGKDLVIHYAYDLNVKIKKRTNCDKFLSMLCSHFDVGIWSPLEHTLLEHVARFLANGSNAQWAFLWGSSYPLEGPIRDLRNLFKMIPDSTHGPTRCLQVDCEAAATARSPPSNVLNIPPWDPRVPDDDFLQRISGPFLALARKQSDIEYCVAYLTKEIGLALLPPALTQESEPAQPLLEASTDVVSDAPLPLGTGSNVKMLDLDDENRAKANVVAHGIIVSLAGGTLHGRLIEEGNASVCVSSIEPGAESVLLYEGNNDDDPPMVRLGDALKSVTKWPMEALQAIPDAPVQEI